MLSPRRAQNIPLVNLLQPLRLSAPSKPDAVIVETPVILAPMAGVTNAAFRQLCAEQGAGLYICEMITARGLVMGDWKTADMLTFADNEKVRSVQTYGADPASIYVAVGILCESFGVNHIDLNFGCPVPKVTRKGGGGALPWKLDLMRSVLKAAVDSADRFGVPVTAKTRIGIDDKHTTYRDFGQIAQDVGVAAVCLHGRTVAEYYGGQANWESIADLVELLDIPVIGNGDIWEASDAIAMIEQTGCAAVEVGRGCLGRPWLFRDLADAMAGRETLTLPNLGEIAALARRHAQLLIKYRGEEHGMPDFRKHTAWYFKGFPLGGEMRQAFGMVSTLQEYDELVAQLDPSIEFPTKLLGKARGRTGRGKRVALPDSWLDSRSVEGFDMSGAEEHVDGG